MKFGASLLTCPELSPLPNNDSTEVNGGLEGGKSLILYQPYAIYTTYRNYEKTHLDRFMWLMKCPRLCWGRLVSYPRTTYRKHWSRYRMNLVNKHYRTLHATAQSHRQQRSFYGYPPESTGSARGTSLSTCQTLICCEFTRRFSVHRSRSYPQRSTNTELESSTGTLQLHTSVTTVYWVSLAQISRSGGDEFSPTDRYIRSSSNFVWNVWSVFEVAFDRRGYGHDLYN